MLLMDVWVLISLLCAFLVVIFVILFVGMLILPVATSSPGHFTKIVLGLAVLNIMGNTFLWNVSLLIIWRTLIDAITEDYENCLQNAEKKMIKAMKKMFIERWMSRIFFNSWQILSKRMADTNTLNRIISYQMERNKALQKDVKRQRSKSNVINNYWAYCTESLSVRFALGSWRIRIYYPRVVIVSVRNA